MTSLLKASVITFSVKALIFRRPANRFGLSQKTGEGGGSGEQRSSHRLSPAEPHAAQFAALRDIALHPAPGATNFKAAFVLRSL
jgi:hypothetical protein